MTHDINFLVGAGPARDALASVNDQEHRAQGALLLNRPEMP